MSTYVVGDIHGCYSEWITLKDRIESSDADAKFILVGDFIDRGPEVIEMLQWAMENITPDGKYQSVVGNHEYMKIEVWEQYLKYKGPEDTIKYYEFYDDRYGFFNLLKHKDFNDTDVDNIITFFKSLPLYKELYIEGSNKHKTHFIVVHADYPYDCRNKDESFRKSSIHYTKIYDPLNNYKVTKNIQNIIQNRNVSGGLYNTKVVHGHTPTIIEEWFNPEQMGKMVVNRNYYNIDCGITFKDCEERNLCALRLEDLTPVYLFETSETREKLNMVY